jgi:hypothetical protein
MHLLASGDEYKFRAFQVRAKFVLGARLSPKVGYALAFVRIWSRAGRERWTYAVADSNLTSFDC